MGQDFIALFVAYDFLFIVTSLISTRMKCWTRRVFY
jgi:hypothetical protein